MYIKCKIKIKYRKKLISDKKSKNKDENKKK